MENKYGKLLTPDIKLHRMWFKQMCDLIGFKVGYRAPRANKSWSSYGEIEANYQEIISIGCIFEENPTQKTMKKLGWVSELQTESSLIQVAYDLPDIQVGCLFYLPSAIEKTNSRLFRCVRMQMSAICPASIVCEIVPEYENTFINTSNNFEYSSFNLLNKEEGYD